MPDKVTILYNEIDPFAPMPVPFVGVQSTPIYTNGYWASAETVTLEGQITGCTFGHIITGQQQLVSNFTKSFQPFEIWQEKDGVSGKMYHKDFSRIESIDFSSANWRGILPYTITLTCYPENVFSGTFGILDPVDSWNFEEQPDATLNAIHNISCRGLNISVTDNNALLNAINWATSRTGLSSFIQPILISGVNSSRFCFQSSEETIDRFNGTYSVSETYTSDLARTGYGILRYNIALDSGNNRIAGIINGNIRGCDKNIVSARNSYNALDKFAALSRQYERIFGRTDLNPSPLSQTINENPYEATIDFSFSYDNLDQPDVYFDHTVSLNSGDAITAGINGTIIARGGDVNDKLQRALAYEGQINLYNLVVPFYNDFYPYASSYPLNPIPTVSGRSINQSNGTVGLNAEFNNNEAIPSPLQEFTFSISFGPAIQKLDSQPILDGLGVYSIVDLGFKNRASLTYAGNALVDTVDNIVVGIATIKQRALQALAQYGGFSNAALEVDEIIHDRRDKRRISFTFTWTFDSPNVVGLYNSVSTLAV